MPPGFVTRGHEDRASRAETEHVAAAENFGRAFPEWREGAPQCVDIQGRTQRRLFETWDRQFPPDARECERERRIARVQGSRNEVTAGRCR